MCIIIVKNIGIAMPKADILQICWKENPDGAGYMFKTSSNQIHIKKGFMTLYQLKKALKKENFTKEDQVIIHFRFGTSGSLKPECTHPFPITKKINELKQLNIIHSKGVVHNGVMGDGYKKMSDTMVFVKDILSDGLIFNNLQRKAIKLLLNDYLGKSNKLAILDKNGIRLFGKNWILDKESGLNFSNYGYLFGPVKVKVFSKQKQKNEIYTTTCVKGDTIICPFCECDDQIEGPYLDYFYCENCDTTFTEDGRMYEGEDAYEVDAALEDAALDDDDLWERTWRSDKKDDAFLTHCKKECNGDHCADDGSRMPVPYKDIVPF